MAETSTENFVIVSIVKERLWNHHNQEYFENVLDKQLFLATQV